MRDCNDSRHPGRHCELAGGRAVLLDAAHYVAGAATLAAYLREAWPVRVPLVFGAMRDKDVAGMLGALGGSVSRMIFTAPAVERAMAPGALVELARATGLAVPVEAVPGVGGAPERACGHGARRRAAGSIGAERAARALPDGMLKTGLLSRPDDLVAGTTLMPPDPFSAALSRKQVKEFVAKAQKERGATADWETGYGTRPGEKQDPGYMVARRGVTGTRKGRKLESTSAELTMPVVDEYVGRKHVRKALEQPGAKLGTWLDEDAQGNPLWYMDVSENIPSRQAAASALINRGEQAAFNTRGNPKRDVAQITSETFPSFPIERKYRAQDTNVRKRAAMEQASASGLLADLAAANASLATEARPNVPAGPQFWPWRIDRGGYELKYDKRPDKYDPGPGHYSALSWNKLAVLKNHGVVSAGTSCASALAPIQVLEEAVRIACVARLFKKKPLNDIDRKIQQYLHRPKQP